MKDKKSQKKEITINIVIDGNEQLEYIDYFDTGPGIDPRFIENELIFEPEFSTKPNGMGLGLAIAGEASTRNGLELAIAGEASTRNGLELKAFESEDGAFFRLQPK